MHYKSIVLALLEDQPSLHRQLQAGRTLHQVLQQLAMALSRCHQEWMQTLRSTRPASQPAQLSSAAMELAVQELRDSLQHASDASGPLSLDAAMEFIRLHTPSAS